MFCSPFPIYSAPTEMAAIPAVVILELLSVLLCVSIPADGTRISGSWNYDPKDNRLKYLTKFGVQKGHQVFAYGGSLRQSSDGHYAFTDTLVLAFVPASIWKEFYNLEKNSRHDCQEILASPFNGSLSPDTRCYRPGEDTEDLYRVVPCDYQMKCTNQHDIPLVPGSNFTFRVVSSEDQFYFLFLLGCTIANASNCDWFTSSSTAINYHVHIVNTDPTLPSNPNPFTYEFSYDLIGMMIIYIIFGSIYLILLLFHACMHTPLCTPTRYKHHPLTLVFSISLLLEALHVTCVMIHYCVFSENGVGVISLFYIGQALNFISDWLLILVLILIGKGWQITTATVRWKKITLVLWLLYIAVSAIFFCWILVEELVFPFSACQRDHHQSWAGGLYLAYRLLLLLYILWEMRQIYLIENRHFKLVLYRALLCLYIVWFCYLPLIVAITSFINVLERARVIAVSILTFDLVANLVMVLLMCPKWSQQYFQFTSHLNTLARVSMKRVRGSSSSYHSVSNNDL